MSDEFVEECIRKLMREFQARPYDRPGKGSPNGIYVYSPKTGKWMLVTSGGDEEPFTPRSDGFFVIYFDNTRCPACRAYDKVWFPYVEGRAPELWERGFRFIIVLCDWFARECGSKAAAESFRKYGVRASPTTILVAVKGGEQVRLERYEGVLNADEIKPVVEGFPERVEAYLRGEEPPDPRKAIRKRMLEEILRSLLGR